MATFTSKPSIINTPAEAIAAKFSDLSVMQQAVDNIPEEQRQKIGDVTFTKDSIVMQTKQVGDITLQVTKRTPEQIVLTALGSPVPMNLIVNLRALDAASTELTTAMEVEIPAMLKPMIGGTLQKAVDQFGELMKTLA